MFFIAIHKYLVGENVSVVWNIYLLAIHKLLLFKKKI